LLAAFFKATLDNEKLETVALVFGV
jgi:hypothetical protein